jgi:glycerophosphodiester phosphodiesterase
MPHLILYEISRSGPIHVTPSRYGILEVATISPIFTAIAESDSLDHLTFEIPNGDNGVFSFVPGLLSGQYFASIALSCGSQSILNVNCALVLPFSGGLTTPCEVEYGFPVVIGHRGFGQHSVQKSYPENSMVGFNAAKDLGARFIEFDVQLTKDETPIILHNFYVETDHPLSEIGQPILEKPPGTFNYALSQFTLSEFQRECPNSPTFDEVLSGLDKSLRFDIELKYPCTKEFAGVVPYPERNHFVDIVLGSLAAKVGDREIFFSAFDVYVVMMLCLKQRRFPVFQLVTKADDESVEIFAKKARDVAGLLKVVGAKGFVLNSEWALRVPEVIAELRAQGFLVFTFGSPNNHSETIVSQLGLGVSGFCTDKLDVLMGTLSSVKADQK